VLSNKAQQKIKEITKFCEALDDCPLQILAIDPNRKKGVNLYPKNKTENEWRLEDLADNINLLQAKNAEGYGIYALAAQSANCDIILIDDVENENRNKEEVSSTSWWPQMKPNIYMRTSPKKTQALFKIDKDKKAAKEKEAYEKERRLQLSQLLNKSIGDPGQNSLRHAFRIPGFRNTKAAYIEPWFVKLESSNLGASSWILEELDKVAPCYENSPKVLAERVFEELARSQHPVPS
jgi:hypothetical protein